MSKIMNLRKIVYAFPQEYTNNVLLWPSDNMLGISNTIIFIVDINGVDASFEMQ